jgi:DNA-directed RNA polymerase specialized sigma24 family protein
MSKGIKEAFKDALTENDAVYTALARSVITRREVMGLSQKELAMILGMSRLCAWPAG